MHLSFICSAKTHNISDLVSEDNLITVELLVEGVLGQGHHLQEKYSIEI
jgi:hypothetical protein